MMRNWVPSNSQNRNSTPPSWASAQAATPTRVASQTAIASTAATPQIANYKLDNNAIKASIVAHQGILTVVEAKRLNIRPNTIYKDTPKIRALAAAVTEHTQQTKATAGSSGSVIHPMSASGCNQDVCIEITGTSNEVSKWYTAAYPYDGYTEICSFPAFWIDGELDYAGYEICGTLLEAWDDATEVFENGTQLCNTWPGVAGRPCEWVWV